MNTRFQIETEGILFIIAAIAGIMLAFTSIQRGNQPKKLLIPVAQVSERETPIPTQTPSPTPTPSTTPLPRPQVSSQLSPDGTKELSLNIITNKDSSKSYTFTTSNSDGSNRLIIYSINLASDSASMSIPFNSWSPDDKYVFINQNQDTEKDALVFRADGQPFTDGESFINATSIFKGKIISDIYDDMTGWASDSLLIINTKNEDGSKGTSYWFEIPSKGIIPLSTQF